MEEQFIKDQIDRTIMEALATLLDDLALRSRQKSLGTELTSEECLIKANSQRLSQQLRHFLSLPPRISEKPDTPQETPQVKSTKSSSRIFQKIREGEIKVNQNSDEEVESETLSVGTGPIEISENDEVVDVVDPSVPLEKRKVHKPYKTGDISEDIIKEAVTKVSSQRKATKRTAKETAEKVVNIGDRRKGKKK